MIIDNVFLIQVIFGILHFGCVSAVVFYCYIIRNNLCNKTTMLAFIVMMAGPGLPGDQIMAAQDAQSMQPKLAARFREIYTLLKTQQANAELSKQLREKLAGEVPGIGRMTARFLASIGFGTPCPSCTNSSRAGPVSLLPKGRGRPRGPRISSPIRSL